MMFNGRAYMKYIRLGRSHPSRIVYIQLFINYSSALIRSRDLQAPECLQLGNPTTVALCILHCCQEFKTDRHIICRSNARTLINLC